MVTMNRAGWPQHTVTAIDRYVAGLDLGKRHDRSVFAVVRHTRAPMEGEAGWYADEKARCWRQRSTQFFDLVAMTTLPAKMDYVAQSLFVRDLMLRDPLPSVTLWVDQTGIGEAVADVMRGQGLKFNGIQITAGTEVSQVDGRTYRVAKQQLVSALESVLHAAEFRVPDTLSEAPAFKQELESFKRQAKASGAQTWNADSGEFDDRVMAAAYAVFGAKWSARHTLSRQELVL